MLSRNESGFVSIKLFPFLGMLNEVDKRVGFWHTIDDE